MLYPHLLYELSPLYLVQGALTIWMLIDAHRLGVDFYWFWIILAFQPFGAWTYFFIYKIKDFTGGTNRFAKEAVPHLKAVLLREPDHRTALFGLAECQRELAQHAEAIPLLLKLVALQSNWRNELAWHTLIEMYQEMGNHTEAVAQARRLAQIVPSLEHKCLLARCLAEAGNVGRPGRSSREGCKSIGIRRVPAGTTGAGLGRRGSCSRRWGRKSRETWADRISTPSHSPPVPPPPHP